jgi:hypothetical protein
VNIVDALYIYMNEDRTLKPVEIILNRGIWDKGE